MPSRCVNQTSWHQVEIKDSSADHQRTLIWGEHQSGNSFKIAQKLDSQSPAWVTVYSSKLSFLFLAPDIWTVTQHIYITPRSAVQFSRRTRWIFSPNWTFPDKVENGLFYLVVERTMMGQIIKHHNTWVRTYFRKVWGKWFWLEVILNEANIVDEVISFLTALRKAFLFQQGKYSGGPFHASHPAREKC